MTTAQFSPDNYRRLAAALAWALDMWQLDAVARVAGPLKVSIYPQSGDLPLQVRSPSTAPFATVFATPAAMIDAARQGIPSAVEVALEVLSVLDSEPAADFGREMLDLGLWAEAKDRAAAALSRSTREASFVRLLDAMREASNAGFQLTQSAYPDGCPLVVARLEASPIMHYEAVSLPSQAEWEAMSESAREATEKRIEAASAAHTFDAVGPAQSFLHYLGEKRCTKAQPLIARLYAEHPSRKIRLSAGHALIDLGDSDSLERVISLAEFHDERRTWFAVKAIITKDPANAVQALGGDLLLTEEGRDKVGNAFRILSGDARDRAKAKSPETPWVLSDPCWLKVAAIWAKDRKSLGAAAEQILDYFPKEDVERAIAPPAKAKAQTAGGKTAGAKKGAAATERSGARALSLLRAKDGQGAWQELSVLGDRLRDPANLGAAREVARETMRSVRENLERIVERLDNAGYRFAYPGHVLLPPPKDIGAQLDELENTIGILPLSLRAAFEYVGPCNLAGDHPHWPKSAHVELRPVKSERDVWRTDPLVLAPIEAILDDTEGWRGRGSFPLAISGDPLAKAGYSAGLYTISVPCEAADAPISGEVKNRMFVKYLRISLEHGGFAGFESIIDRPQPLIDMLVAGCAKI